MLQNIIISLAPFVLIAAGIIVCVYVFISLKREISALERKVEENEARLGAALQGLQPELSSLRQGIQEAEQRAGVLVPPAPPKSGLNLNKRSQALKLYRRGELPEKIAAALGLPRREVDLLLKVQKIVIGATKPNSTS